jgi:WD40 repeat protein
MFVVWDDIYYKLVNQTPTQNQMLSLWFSNITKFLYSGSTDGSISVWNIDTVRLFNILT